jgi:hypothetical protein
MGVLRVTWLPEMFVPGVRNEMFISREYVLETMQEWNVGTNTFGRLLPDVVGRAIGTGRLAV